MNFKLNNLMKQAQEMQAKMQQAQREIEQLETDGEAGGGAVTVTMTGKHRVTRIKVDPTVWDEDQEVIIDLFIAAFNAATQKVEEVSKQKLSALTAGIELPEGFGS